MTTIHIIPTNERKIKAQMMLRGVRQIDVARKLKCSSTAVRKVISGVPCSNRIKAEIAIRLGTTPAKLWPNKTKRNRTPHI